MPTPSAKTIADIQFYWDKVERNVFDQSDFKNLIITLRDYAPKNSRLNEIGTFIAHPTRDKGSTHQHLSLLKISQKAGAIEFMIPVGYNVDELLKSLSETLIARSFGTSEAVHKTVAERSAELSICFLGMLHHAVVKISGQVAVLKIVGFMTSMMSPPQTTLELRAILQSGANLSLITTKLQSRDWCDFNTMEIEKTERVCAIRMPDGLKLRKF